MKHSFSFSILFLVPVALFAQYNYEPGYFISNDGQRTECNIKNLDWRSSPTSFEYQANGTEGKGNLETIKEFGITGGSVFRRFTVLIDRSTNDINRLSNDRAPSFKQETLFLRLLVNGKAILYMYDDQGLLRFFYSLGGEVSQLVYKKYMPMASYGATSFAKENEQYKQQLLNELACGSISQRDVEKLKYERAPLMKFFDRYNECTGTTVATNEDSDSKSTSHIGILAGAGFNTFSAPTANAQGVALRFGIDLEVPIKKGWSISFQPVFQSFSSNYTGSFGPSKVEYSSVDFGAGVRRYLVISETNNIYVDVGGVYSTFTIASDALNFKAGVGYRVSSFFAELSYGFSRNIDPSKYSGMIVMVGYRLR